MTRTEATDQRSFVRLPCYDDNPNILDLEQCSAYRLGWSLIGVLAAIVIAAYGIWILS